MVRNSGFVAALESSVLGSALGRVYFGAFEENFLGKEHLKKTSILEKNFLEFLAFGIVYV